MTNNEAWDKLFEKHDIQNQVDKHGIFEISANQIKEFREPRLMTKFDTYESRPSAFGRKIAILPNSRGTYEFIDLKNYSSIQFLRQKNYSFEETTISEVDLHKVYRSTEVKPEPTDVPFIQANSFNIAISILEMVKDNPMTKEKIAENVGFNVRQADYYFNACKYLGLAEKTKDDSGRSVVVLTRLGKSLLEMPYKKRQLKYVSLMLEHEILSYSFELAINNGNIPDAKLLASKITELRLCHDSAERRASTVSAWTKWIFDLIND